jgi:hypothetical protein
MMHIVELAGFSLYAVPFLWLGTKTLTQRSGQSAVTNLQRFVRFGPMLGLSLGICIFGSLGGLWLDYGQFSWTGMPDQFVARQLIFGMMWVSNIKFEIWTLDGIRDMKPEPTTEMITTALGPVHRHLWLHCLLLLILIGLSLSI